MKRRVRSGVRVRAYEVLRRAVEEGVACGWMRAHKYADTPEAEAVKEAVINSVLGSVCELFEFDEVER